MFGDLDAGSAQITASSLRAISIGKKVLRQQITKTARLIAEVMGIDRGECHGTGASPVESFSSC